GGSPVALLGAPAHTSFPGGGGGGAAPRRAAHGTLLVTAEGTETVPTFEIDVVDTTGCGDAFSAGFLRGVGLGRTPHEAAVLGNAVAALVAQGLGSDHGDFDLAAVDAFAAASARRA
ncbi:carbohydrate kinase family protein, partial [Streptomyces sp. NPDC051016]|uniref:carbohydrate kinase family protein n=1 Tax=Streptomyces sp. NPDC051016 TaxID=3365638 RepID=UPI0037915102